MATMKLIELDTLEAPPIGWDKKWSRHRQLFQLLMKLRSSQDPWEYSLYEECLSLILELGGPVENLAAQHKLRTIAEQHWFGEIFS